MKPTLRSRSEDGATLHYLNNGYGLKSWLLTKDHKRIAIMYPISTSVFFVVGGFIAVGSALQSASYTLTIDGAQPPALSDDMNSRPSSDPNVKQAVPFFGVTDIEASLRFYVDGLGCTMTRHWAPEGRIRWCRLEIGTAALMLQEYWKDGRPGGGPAGALGAGVSICFMCTDAIAIYHEANARGLEPSTPLVGNNLWVTSFVDPDGYRLDFESPTDVPEGTVYANPS